MKKRKKKKEKKLGKAKPTFLRFLSVVLTFKAVLSKNLTGDDTKSVVESGHGEHGQHLPCQGPEATC
jgi:hypothetical protein